MDRKTAKRVSSFSAVSESGKGYIIDVVQMFREVRDVDGLQIIAVGPTKLQTREGQAVNQIEKGVYEFACKPWGRLTSDDPNAC